MAVLSVRESAEVLGLHEAGVRRLVAAGDLPARKVGGRWLIEAGDLDRFRRAPRVGGRPYSPRMAWGILDLACGGEARWLDRFERSKARRRLEEGSLVELVPRLRRRAELYRFYAHPGVLDRLAGQVVRSGASAAAEHDFDIVARDEVEGYVHASELAELVGRYKLRVPDGDHNVVLRAVGEPWPFGNAEVAPRVVAALDLCEADDDRSRRAGQRALRVSQR